MDGDELEEHVVHVRFWLCGLEAWEGCPGWGGDAGVDHVLHLC